jgi:hypothetical protein
MGVAALGPGELEYMTMRRITSGSDNQGPWPLDDKLPMEDQVRLMLSTVQASEMLRFPTALALEEPFSVLYRTQQPPLAAPAPPAPPSLPTPAQAPAQAPAPAIKLTGFPASVWAKLSVRLEAPSNATYVIRLQNVVAGGAAVTVPSLSAALGMRLHSCVETTMTIQQTRDANAKVRLQWKTEEDEEGQGEGRGEGSRERRWEEVARTNPSQTQRQPQRQTRQSDDGARNDPLCGERIVLDSLDIRTFTFGVSPV